MSFQFCTSGSAIAMAGTNANSDLIAYGGTNKTILDSYSEHCEGEMMLETGMDLSGSLTSMNGGIRNAVGNICASKIAMKIVAYDTTGYLSREADTLLNVNVDIINKGMKQLKDFSNFSLKTPT